MTERVKKKKKNNSELFFRSARHNAVLLFAAQIPLSQLFLLCSASSQIGWCFSPLTKTSIKQNPPRGCCLNVSSEIHLCLKSMSDLLRWGQKQVGSVNPNLSWCHFGEGRHVTLKLPAAGRSVGVSKWGALILGRLGNVTEIETEGAYHIMQTSGGCNKKMQVEERGSRLIKPDWLYSVALILTDVLCSLRNTKIKEKAGYCVTLIFFSVVIKQSTLCL